MLYWEFEQKADDEDDALSPHEGKSESIVATSNEPTVTKSESIGGTANKEKRLQIEIPNEPTVTKSESIGGTAKKEQPPHQNYQKSLVKQKSGLGFRENTLKWGTAVALRYAIGHDIKREESFLSRQFAFIDQSKNGWLSYEEVEQGWHDMNITPNRKDLQAQFRAQGVANNGDVLEVDAAGLRIMMLQAQKGLHDMVKPWFKIWAASDEFMTADELDHFFKNHSYGNENKVSVEEVRQLLDGLNEPYVKSHGNSRCLTLAGFTRLLTNPENNIVDRYEANCIQQEMTLPLTSYWIACSHNTYLEGNQLTGYSNVQEYVRVLRRGCRCIEIDAWDGDDGEPAVKHGHTATTSISFRNIIEAIYDHAFESSPYPVIISIEQNCHQARQLLRQAAILTEVLDKWDADLNCSRLLKPEWDNEKNEVDWANTKMPSPEEAKHQFIIKSSLCSCKRCKLDLGEYNRVIFMPTMKPHFDGSELDAFFSPSNKYKPIPVRSSGRTGCHCSSYTEGKVNKWIKTELSRGNHSIWRLQRWHQSFFSRVYPEAWHISSSNYDPLSSWTIGAQLIAMNYQTPDHWMLLNEALFEASEAGCGYKLKSKFAQGFRKHSEYIAEARIKIDLIGAFRLPKAGSTKSTNSFIRGFHKQASSPYVRMCLTTSEERQEVVSKTVRQNGYDPAFDCQAVFRIGDNADPELCFLTFEVVDDHNSENIAHAALQVKYLKQGLRCVQLNAPNGGLRIQNAGLLINQRIESLAAQVDYEHWESELKRILEKLICEDRFANENIVAETANGTQLEIDAAYTCKTGVSPTDFPLRVWTHRPEHLRGTCEHLRGSVVL